MTLPATESTTPPDTPRNIVQRLRDRTADAQLRGFEVRFEALDDEEPTWVIVRRKKIIFLDVTHTASEQLRHLDVILRSAIESQTASVPRTSVPPLNKSTIPKSSEKHAA